MTTFTTIIKSMQTIPDSRGKTNVVVVVQYEVIGVNGSYTTSIDSSSQIVLNQNGNFTPYEQLTETQVIGWIPVQIIAKCQAYVESQIQSMITPPVSPTAKNLPWAQIPA